MRLWDGSRHGLAAPRRRAAAYLHGSLAPVARKNGWQLAEAAGDRTLDGVQDFLGRMHRDADAVRDDLHAYVVQHPGDPDLVMRYVSGYRVPLAVIDKVETRKSPLR